MSSNKTKIVVSYVPVLHEGYRRFFEKHSDSETLFIFGKEMIDTIDYLKRKDIRALDPVFVKKSIESWGVFKEVKLLDFKSLEDIKNSEAEIVLADEDVTREVAENHFQDRKVYFDQVFLRWDKHRAMEKKPVKADQRISREEFDKEVMGELLKEAEKSHDWWRRIAAAVVKDGEVVLITHNKHLPSTHSLYAHGDPRSVFKKGIGIEYSNVLHSEAGLVAEAARKGISLEGTDMYVSTFPCPSCAKQIAYSGIKRLFYSGGYSVLDQESILKSRGVEIVFVDLAEK